MGPGGLIEPMAQMGKLRPRGKDRPAEPALSHFCPRGFLGLFSLISIALFPLGVRVAPAWQAQGSSLNTGLEGETGFLGSRGLQTRSCKYVHCPPTEGGSLEEGGGSGCSYKAIR